jgi:hypothetical protein
MSSLLLPDGVAQPYIISFNAGRATTMMQGTGWRSHHDAADVRGVFSADRET